MKYSIVVNLILIYIGLQSISCGIIPSDIKTPKAFVSQVKALSSTYSGDSLKVASILQSELKGRRGFFKSSAYFDSTEVIIDSILYNPGLDKLAILILVKNPTYRQLIHDNRSFWYYDGTYYLGKRQADSLRLQFIGPSFTNSVDPEELSRILRFECLNNFAELDSNNVQIKFNFNDKRFWEADRWNKF